MDTSSMKAKVIEAIKEVYDPELPVNVYDLGLIYEIAWDPKAKCVAILMTLTTPSCPASEMITYNIKKHVSSLPEVQEVVVDITFDPPYTPDRLSEEARLLLDWDIT